MCAIVHFKCTKRATNAITTKIYVENDAYVHTCTCTRTSTHTVYFCMYMYLAGPQLRDSVVVQGVKHGLQLLAHDHETFEGFEQVLESAVNHLQ